MTAAGWIPAAVVGLLCFVVLWQFCKRLDQLPLRPEKDMMNDGL